MRTAHIYRSSHEGYAVTAVAGHLPTRDDRIDGQGDAVLIIHPDFTRTIDLPGAGPCPRPVDVDRAATGFTRLVSLRGYSFSRGSVINGDAEADEVFIVLMRGQVDLTIMTDGREAGAFVLEREGGMRAVYMPPNASYRLTAIVDCDIAYARAKPVGATVPAARGFSMAEKRLEVLDYAGGMNLALAMFREGDRVEFAGALPERFVHLRSDEAMTAIIGDEPLADWDTVALDEGELAVLEVRTGGADILTISASR